MISLTATKNSASGGSKFQTEMSGEMSFQNSFTTLTFTYELFYNSFCLVYEETYGKGHNNLRAIISNRKLMGDFCTVHRVNQNPVESVVEGETY